MLAHGLQVFKKAKGWSDKRFELAGRYNVSQTTPYIGNSHVMTEC
jgi:hypothetical protein